MIRRGAFRGDGENCGEGVFRSQLDINLHV